jgi:hypothetical protein
MKTQKQTDLILLAKEKIANKVVPMNLSLVSASILMRESTCEFEFKGKLIKLSSTDLDSCVHIIDNFLAKQSGVAIEGKGYIYLVSDGENTKIGATTYNPTKRLNELQAGNAKKLTLVGSYQVERRIATEALLHEIYADKIIRGEWFKLSGQDIVDILNKRMQSSVNNDYRVLTTKQAGEIMSVIWCASLWLDMYRHKIITRLERVIGEPSRWAEFKMHIEKIETNKELMDKFVSEYRAKHPRLQLVQS